MRTDHKDMLSVLGHFFLEHGQTDKALVLLDALQALFPEDPDIAKSLSYACLQAGRYQEALDAANRGSPSGMPLSSISCEARRCGASVEPMKPALAWLAISP
ncbi:MAG: tetratricopeptide repeat protein [Candidatus Competibacteraceae bacterium]|nr:tetratricopeptide repeat protein [Candidatus Competibacteraceae bacterium]